MQNILTDRKEKTLKRYEQVFKEIERILQPKKLSDFTPEALGNIRTTLKKNADTAHVGLNGVNKILVCLKTVLRTAEENDFSKRLKLQLLKSFTITSKPLHMYEIWQLVLIRRYARPTYKALAFLCCRAGLRPEEPRNLLKTSINWEKRQGLIEPHSASKGVTAWTPKVNTIRPFSLEDSYLWEALEELPQTDSVYLLTNRYGEPFSDSGLLNSWKKELKRINNLLESFYKDKNKAKELAELKSLLKDKLSVAPIRLEGNLKDFRKTFATHLEEREEVKKEDIAFLLGHRPQGMTDTHYFVKNFDKKRVIIKYLPKIEIT